MGSVECSIIITHVECSIILTHVRSCDVHPPVGFSSVLVLDVGGHFFVQTVQVDQRHIVGLACVFRIVKSFWLTGKPQHLSGVAQQHPCEVVAIVNGRLDGNGVWKGLQILIKKKKERKNERKETKKERKRKRKKERRRRKKKQKESRLSLIHI